MLESRHCGITETPGLVYISFDMTIVPTSAGWNLMQEVQGACNLHLSMPIMANLTHTYTSSYTLVYPAYTAVRALIDERIRDGVCPWCRLEKQLPTLWKLQRRYRDLGSDISKRNFQQRESLSIQLVSACATTTSVCNWFVIDLILPVVSRSIGLGFDFSGSTAAGSLCSTY